MHDKPVHLKNAEKNNMGDVDMLAYVSRCQPGPLDDVMYVGCVELCKYEEALDCLILRCLLCTCVHLAYCYI